MITMCGDLTFRHKQAAQFVFFNVRNFREGFMLAALRKHEFLSWEIDVVEAQPLGFLQHVDIDMPGGSNSRPAFFDRMARA